MYLPIVLLFFSNIFMTYAWYGHLKDMKAGGTPLYVAILVSWGIAFFEYTLMIPANRMGSLHYTLPQLKIMQEVITMIVFFCFSYFYMKTDLKLDYLWASMCLVGAVYFMFRSA